MSAELSDEQILDHYATTISTSQGAYLIAVARKIIGSDRALRSSGGRLDPEMLAAMHKHAFDELYDEGDVHQVSAPVEISSCATCGHPVESGGKRSAAIECEVLLARAARIITAYSEALRWALIYVPDHSLARQRIDELGAELAASGSQESGSTECKESSPLSPASKGIDHE